MKKTLVLIMVIFMVVLPFFTGCQKKVTNNIVIATDATWPPMEMVDTNKNIVGFDIDFMSAVAEAAGFKVEFRNTAWDGIFAGLANSDYDAVISSVTITDDRKKTMDFSMPYINAGQVLIVPKSDNNSKILNDLTGKDVGAQIGTTGAFAITDAKGVNLKTYDEIGLAVEDLANGRIAGVVCDSPIAADYVLQNEHYKGTLKIVGVPFTEEYYGVAVKKGNSEIIELMNKGIKSVIDSGKAEELKDKWLR